MRGLPTLASSPPQEAVAEFGFIRLFGGISDCLTASEFTEAWLGCDLWLDSKKPVAEILSQGLTRLGERTKSCGSVSIGRSPWSASETRIFLGKLLPSRACLRFSW